MAVEEVIEEEALKVGAVFSTYQDFIHALDRQCEAKNAISIKKNAQTVEAHNG